MGEKKAVVAVEVVAQEQEGERKEVVDMLAAQMLATSEGVVSKTLPKTGA